MRHSLHRNKALILSVCVLLALLARVPLRAAAGARGSERELFSEAERRYFGRRYLIALDLYERFLAEYPLSTRVPDVQYRRAVCLFRLDRIEEARTAFAAVEKRYRATRYIGYVPFWQGVIAYRSGDNGDAKERLGVFLSGAASKEPETRSQALLYKALAETSLGEFGQARTTLSKLVEEKGAQAISPYEAVLYSYLLLKEGSHAELLAFQERIDLRGMPASSSEKLMLYKAEALLAAGETDKAENVYGAILDAEPSTALIAYHRLYRSAQRKGNFFEMERIVQGAEAKFAGSPSSLEDFWVSIGIESFRRGDYDLARLFLVKAWNSLKARGGARELVPVYLSELDLRRGDVEGAVRVLEEFASAEGASSRALLRLGAAYMRAGRHDDASARFQQILRTEKDRRIRDEALYLLAYAQYRKGDFAASLDNLNRVAGVTEDRSLRAGALRIKALALKASGRPAEAARTLEDYAALVPGDDRIRLDIIRLKFESKDYAGVISSSTAFLAGSPDTGEKDLRTRLLVLYLKGLSEVAVKSYPDAVVSFEAVSREKAAKASLEMIHPFARYYSAWAHYRNGDLDKGVRGFSGFLREYPSHPLHPEARFMEGWCLYSLGDYAGARVAFSRVSSAVPGSTERVSSRASDESLVQKARFLEGKSLLNLKRLDEAQGVFFRIYRETPGSAYADDALFEYAGILEARGKAADAAVSYLELANRFPDSPLVAEALYKRGEAYFNAKSYAQARSAFNTYRQRVPDSKLVDAALYWEGMSAYESGDRREAILLWGLLAAEHPASTFVPDALLKQASAHENLGEYREALDLLRRLARDHPQYAKAAGADLAEARIRYKIFGMGEREAELTALISKGGGTRTREGRAAMLELAGIYLSGDPSKRERAFQMMSQVAEHGDDLTGSRAQFLLGEYYWQRGEWENAGREFIKASLRNPADRDFAASAILRAAQAMKKAGRDREVRELVKRLQDNFPGSQWADEGKKLLGGGR